VRVGNDCLDRSVQRRIDKLGVWSITEIDRLTTKPSA